jgi:hypothetical protein
METQVVKSNEKGERFNRWNELVIACKTGCGRDTTMTGTCLCDHCWEGQRAAEHPGRQCS